jgi:hypothetical protein
VGEAAKPEEAYAPNTQAIVSPKLRMKISATKYDFFIIEILRVV